MAFSVASLVLTAYSAYENHKNNQDVAGENRKQRRLENAKSSDAAARQRRDQIRQQRIQTASIQNQAVTQNVSGSSAPLAAIAGVQTSANLNIGEINSAQAFGQVQGKIQQNIFDLQQPSGAALAAGVVSQAANIFAPTQQLPKSSSGAPVTTSQVTPRP